MITEERYREILSMLREKPTVTVQELTERLHTSESTVRRDLTALHRAGQLRKVHGGATVSAMHYTVREEETARYQDDFLEEKQRIGRYAATLIQKGELIYIDAGISVGSMLEHIKVRDAVFVTNSIFHANQLASRGLRVLLLGGELDRSAEAVVGEEALRSLRRYNFAKGFFGAGGVSIRSGFTTVQVGAAAIKAQALSQCEHPFVLCDPSKFGRVAPVTFASLRDAVIITTAVQDQEMKKKARIWEADTP
jgi:DeoR family fructose operon transcriptional repressor